MRTLFHGSRVIVEYPEIRVQRYQKDFFWGFYCTDIERQAVRWATKVGAAALSIKQFPEMTEEWLDFVAACRSGIPHSYDVVEGPMADDTIFNYVQSFLDGEISRAAFWELARFKRPTHQISFHTAASLAALTFERSYVTDV